jgi:hypothetical protein
MMGGPFSAIAPFVARRNAGLFLEGLLGDEQRKTGWMIMRTGGE